MAASSTYTTFGKSVKVHRVDWVSAADGSCTASIWLDGKIERIVTVPSASAAPTDNYDLTIVDEDGYDIAAGALANRDTATTEVVVPSAAVVHYGACTFTVANAGDTKAGTIKIYVR